MWLMIPVDLDTLRKFHLPEILMVPVQQNVTVEIGLLKSNKKACQLWNKKPRMYVDSVSYDSNSILTLLNTDDKNWRKLLVEV